MDKSFTTGIGCMIKKNCNILCDIGFSRDSFRKSSKNRKHPRNSYGNFSIECFPGFLSENLLKTVFTNSSRDSLETFSKDSCSNPHFPEFLRNFPCISSYFFSGCLSDFFFQNFLYKFF